MNSYGHMSDEDLVKETERLRREAKQKINEGLFHEVNVLEQQYYFAKSYLMRREKIKINATYHVHGEAGLFKVTRLRGVMAWGYINNEEPERAFPIARLYRPEWSDKGEWL